MRAMVLGVLLGLLLPAAGQAQSRLEIMAALLADDSVKYAYVAGSDAPFVVMVIDKTTMRTVNNKPRAWFIVVYDDHKVVQLIQADCVEHRFQTLAVTHYDREDKWVRSAEGTSDWGHAVPGSFSANVITRLCK
jgi:hypothetical protein